ncbi:MAG: cytochrome b [Solidesulfovibrio sp.]|uniref:cytochrome b n=1 Tax=Solidesulfovibrio sp. TaxID=2910990 RepID=UPI002B2042F0|nr:cytochrome b [Solidesulfovibrio sp.]MEA4857561.1 cytochrome b [Solidesulfovibrio sp.]
MSAKRIVLAYDPVWKTIHWLTVALVAALLAIGWTMSGGVLFMWHASLGAVVFAVTLGRLSWRASHAAPSVPVGLRPWEVTVLAAVQRLFYLLLLAQPVIGWALYSLSPRYTRLFGLTTLPKLPALAGIGKDSLLRDILEGAHGTVAALLVVLFVLHAGAALKHHFILRDSVLLRMAPAGLGPLLRRLRGE